MNKFRFSRLGLLLATGLIASPGFASGPADTCDPTIFGGSGDHRVASFSEGMALAGGGMPALDSRPGGPSLAIVDPALAPLASACLAPSGRIATAPTIGPDDALRIAF